MRGQQSGLIGICRRPEPFSIRLEEQSIKESENDMTRLGIFGIAALAFAMSAPDALAQRRGGGAVSGGMRGAVVGGMVGGSEGAATGAKIGVVTGATRAAVNRETQARGQYYSTADYQNAQHSNFYEAPPETFGTTAAGTPTKPGVEAVIRKDDKPVVGITFPSDFGRSSGTSRSTPRFGPELEGGVGGTRGGVGVGGVGGLSFARARSRSFSSMAISAS